MLGFIILSHDNPRQLRRLVDTLNRIYDFPPIACHHDITQSRLDLADFENAGGNDRGNVHFVDRTIKTGWGQWSLVEATLLALKTLYDNADPEWFILLSASDYPIADAESVRRDLEATSADALMDYRMIPRVGDAVEVDGAAACLSHHGSEGNVRLARIRYLRTILKIPMLRNDARGRRLDAKGDWRIGAFTASFNFTSPLSPFRSGYECYVGSQWFTANRRTAQYLLDPDMAARKLARYLRWRVVPDETYFQSLLCNDDRFRIDPDPRRYADWGKGGAHPKMMTIERVENAIASGAHFARKFSHDSPELDYLDDRLMGRP